MTTARTRWTVSGVLAAFLLAGCVVAPEESGRQDYQALCAGCHGDDGRGDGPALATLDAQVPDLTLLATANGGIFPRVRVMSQIDGYTRDQTHGGMPAFWPLLEGDTVLVETEPGVMTPTPARLVALARYIESIQQ